MPSSVMKRYLAEGDPPVAMDPRGDYDDPQNNIDDMEAFARQVADANAASRGITPPPWRNLVDTSQPSPGIPPYLKPQAGEPGYVSQETPESLKLLPGEPGYQVPPDKHPYLGDSDDIADASSQGDRLAQAVREVTPTPAAARPRDSYSSRIDDYERLLKTRPVLSEPKWYQRLGAAALGGAAGWSNAAGRTRTPIDIDAATQGILHPGYAGKLATWQSRVVPAQEMIKLEGERNAAAWKGQQIQNETALKEAQAKAAMQHGAYWQSRSEQERNQWKVDAKTGKLYNTINGTWADRPDTPEDRYQTAIALHRTPEEASFYALNKKLPDHPDHNVSEWQSYMDEAGGDPAKALSRKRADEINRSVASRPPRADTSLADELKEQRLTEGRQRPLDEIANKKNASQRMILDARQKEIERVFGSGKTEQDVWNEKDSGHIGQLKAINRQFAPQLQAIEDTFVGGAAGRHVTGTPQDIDPDTLQYHPRVVTVPPVVTQPPIQAAGPGRGAPAPIRKYNARGDAVEWNGKQWLPVQR